MRYFTWKQELVSNILWMIADEGEIPSIAVLATIAALNTVNNKISDVSN